MGRNKKTDSNSFEDLVMEYLTGTLADNDLDAFLKSVTESEENRQKLTALEEAYAASYTERFETIKRSNFDELMKRMKKSHQKKSFSVSKKSINDFLTVAAVIICTFISVFSFSKYIEKKNIISSMEQQETKFTVPYGSTMTAELPDGTQVKMNSGSTLSFKGNMGNEVREVSFEGEGYFIVSRNPERPFEIHSGDLDVRVLGTVFNIRNYKEDATASVALESGSVEVFSSEHQIKLVPSQVATLNKKTSDLSIYETDVADISDWTSGKFRFNHMSVPALMRELERKYGVEIIYDDNCFKGELFTGKIRLDQSIEEVLKYLDVDNKLTLKKAGKKIYLKIKD